MKRIKLLLTLLIAFIMLASVSLYANQQGINENDEIDIPYATPVIDGVIDKTDGWSGKAYLNDETCGYFVRLNPLTTTADLYYAYDNNGLYFAADITENNSTSINGFVYSTGLDDINGDGKGSSPYGYNGDVLIFTLDPFGRFFEEGYLNDDDYTPWYCVGLFENGARMYRSRVNNGDITDDVTISGTATEDGWRFEAFIPWEIIIKDTSDISSGDITFTKKDIMNGEDMPHRATCMYMDRFLDIESETNETWGCYITACQRTYDGTPGNFTNGMCVKAYGLTMFFDYHVPGKWVVEKEATFDSEGSKTRRCTDCGILLERAVINPISFNDINRNAWYMDAVAYCHNHSLFNGTGTNTFSPDSNMTRAMFVTVLSNIANADVSKYKNSSFSDVNVGQWYAPYIEWAYQNKLTNGIGNGKFGPDDSITREQTVVFMKAFYEYLGFDVVGRADLNVYEDAKDISTWAYGSMEWAVNLGLISGTTKTKLSPKDSITRVQVAQIAMNFEVRINGK